MYCLKCGSPAHHAIPEGDTRPRLVCPACGHIHYENPKMVCGVLAVHEGRILLCRRAIEPRYGLWTLPAGFMENGETMAEGAKRETVEEADGVAVDLKLYALYDLPHWGQIHAMYLANLKDGAFGVGVESLECALFYPDEIDMENLAFETVRQTIERYLADKDTLMSQGKDADDFAHYPLHEVCIHHQP
ncbi:NUDIX hydrolase [Moraxella nasibovis]|uniref:NUDIX hydrolase n=1 Tax=Moraxella nasibovis TaxID=2904120 RepID=UPI00240F9C75|nr:NUDIX hydrolase [Moraxella nasibovis]WFF39740.1 NUDIX hydrolase [Moraxella nasibovis]